MLDINALNSNQIKVAKHLDGPILILAGAGSGKTRTITYRMAHMIKVLKIDPKQILALTFTNKAAREMKERVKGLLKNRKSPFTLTFHSLCLQILKEEIHHLGYQRNFTLYDQNDQNSLIREALNQFKTDKNFDRSTILSMIGKLKNNSVSPTQYQNSEFFDESNEYCYAAEYCYHFYTEKLKFYNAIDFDDILLLTSKLFKEHSYIANKYSQKFKYILVDEYQDTNPLQFDILKGLTSMHSNICVVGDDDQSIYRFRGANIENILNFEAHFPGTLVIKLEENYRSTQNILNLSNNVIKENKKRKSKTLWTQNDVGKVPHLWFVQDDVHEAQIICDEVTKLQETGVSLENIAVLYRSNTQIPPIEDELRINLIPYRIIGGKKLYDRKEIKDLISYVSIILNPFDEISLRRVLNTPSRGIGVKTLEKYVDLSLESQRSLFLTLRDVSRQSEDTKVQGFFELVDELKTLSKQVSIADFIKQIIDRTHYHEFIRKFYKEEKQIEIRKNLINTLIESAERFQNQKEIEPTLMNFLNRILLADSQDHFKENMQGQNELTLMTLHSSKGLEFDYVFLVGVEEELLPHKKSIILGEDIEEERRLFYVGITRAKKRLYMTSCKERRIYNKNMKRMKSRFLNKVDDYYLTQDRTTLEHLSEEEAEAYKAQLFNDLLSTLD